MALAPRIILAVALLARAAYVVRLRRGRPDAVPLWLAVKLAALDIAIAGAALAAAAGSQAYLVALWVAALVGIAIALRLWTSRRWLTHPLEPADAAREAARLAHGALDLADSAERAAAERGKGGEYGSK